MSVIVLKFGIIATIALFLLPKRRQYFVALLISSIIIASTSILAVQVMFFSSSELQIAFMPLLGETLSLHIDKLSSFFILVINFTVFTGFIYAKGYLKPYHMQKGKVEMAWHYFNLIWLQVSMLLVVMIRDALAFLIIWEVMSLSSFFLVIFESEKRESIKIGLNYLIQMHIGVVLLMVAFIWASMQGGEAFSFDGLATYFATHDPFWVFLLFFIGFGFKAGFIPLHTWLPHAHPAAPSHVSGMMSAVMIKMGIYGILRVLSYIHHDLFGIGLFILIISLISGLIGVSLAIVQHDVKKLLAYHSIENIGIIGIGIGLGVIGLAEKMPLLAALGFAGGLLHILNHSLFKSLLFFTAGSVYQQTHTRNIEQLGGLIKKMPKTALFFLLGALAISGLPPFNGFISEFLIYSAMFKSLQVGSLELDFILLFSFAGLAIIGGLAVFCFTKVFSIVFLGHARTEKVSHAKEVESSMIFPDYLIGLMIILIGFVPIIIITPLARVVAQFTTNISAIEQVTPVMINISWSAAIFIGVIGVLWILRSWQQKKHAVKQAATWGCGYTGANPALHQYTATSYADSFAQLSSNIVHVKKTFKEFDENEIFPSDRKFETHSSDIFENTLVSKPGVAVLKLIKHIAVFQTGKIQHYLLYALVFLATILLLTYFNLI